MKKCSFCKQEIPKNSERCPYCSTICKGSFNILFYFFGVVLLLAGVFIAVKPTNFQFDNVKFAEMFNYQEQSDNQEDYVDIDIRPPVNLSGMTRGKILYNRKKYVNESIVFEKLKSYTPNPEVYQIESGLPWVSVEQETRMYAEEISDISDGISRHSIHIRNPEMLIGLIPYGLSKGPYYALIEKVGQAYLYQLPKRIAWNKKNNIIKAYFDVSRIMDADRKYEKCSLSFEDTNARDFGYNWIYAYEFENIDFGDEENISKVPYQMRGFYHKGYACRLKSGCNNYSPNQPQLHLYLTGKGYIKFKLWKEKPLFTAQKPDMTYIMHFE